MSIASDSPFAKAKDGKVEANIHVTVRISDHALEADFYGVVVVDFTDVKIAQAGPEQTIWQAKRCHQNRGLPKAVTTDIRGTISDGEANIQISAAPRHIGKLIQPDEIIVTKRLPRTLEGLGTELSIQAQTSATRLVFALRLIAMPCEL